MIISGASESEIDVKRVTTLGLGMSIKRIAQPYVVYWRHNDSYELEVQKWCEENIVNHLVVFTGKADSYLINLKQIEHEKMSHVDVFMFECPRDAMLFKLTWGGT